MKETSWTTEQLEKIPVEILAKMYMEIMQSNAELKRTVELLTEQIRIMNQRNYGRKTESSSQLFDKLQPQLDLGFNEPEAAADKNEKEPGLDEVKPHRRKQKGTKKNNLAKITNHRDVNIEISEEELDEKFGKGKWKKLPDQIIEKLEHHPAFFEVVSYHIGVYAADDNQTIVRAEKPVEMFQKSVCTPSLLSSIIFAKYVNHVPLYRQEQVYSANEVFINRRVMANWVIRAAQEYLQYIFDKMRDVLISRRYLHADETPFLVNKDGRPANSKSYMWVYRTTTDEAEPQIVLYQYCHTRGHQNPKTFLDGFKGTLITDGYQVYHKLEKETPDQFKVAGCWVHCKRKFSEIVKASGKARGTGLLAEEGVKKISEIYKVDKTIHNETTEEGEILKKRQDIIGPLVDEFFTWVKQNSEWVDEESAIGKAFTYAKNQKKYLREFLNDGNVPLDNNAAERAIRPFCIGRKNWIMIDTPAGADSSSVIYSIVETARANNLNMYEYMKYLLEELPEIIQKGKEVPDRLMPWSSELPDKVRKPKSVPETH